MGLALQIGPAVVPLVVALLILLVAAATVYSSVRVVEEGDLEALLVLGEMRAVLVPGLNFVPPFVSKTYPIDPSTGTIEKGDERVPVPGEFRDRIEEHADGDHAERAGVEYPDDGW